jgi:hypothetical protein
MTTDILSNDVKHLSRSDFSRCGSLLNYKSGVSVVMFYVSSSRFCQTFAPDYKKLSKMCSADCNVLCVNMEQGTNNSLFSLSSNYPYDISNFPTIIVFFNGDPCSVYLKERTADALYNYLRILNNKQQCTFNFVPCE